ncbi:uncharacterized protein [Nicotiana sylvestris]|uniref:uncharacterized protein n=1 Tax=Nicotiana sylvestris TaxID=4096 RepID=UPI00388CBC78
MLKKEAATKWTDDCQRAFNRIKEYLSAPPVFVPPEPGRLLLLYLTVLDGAFGCVLGQHDETGRKEQALYYLREDIAESYEGWRMSFDRAENFKEVGIGAVLISETGQHYPVSARLKFSCTNNMAEYEACILGLKMAIDMNIQELLELRKSFTKTEFQHFPRVQNEFADTLATLSSMMQHLDKNFIDPIPVKINDQPAYYAHVKEEVDGKPWFHDIKEYLAK